MHEQGPVDHRPAVPPNRPVRVSPKGWDLESPRSTSPKRVGSLPPGRARLVASPPFNGSELNATTGIVLVAALKTITTGLVPVTIKSGLRVTISRAKSA